MKQKKLRKKESELAKKRKNGLEERRQGCPSNNGHERIEDHRDRQQTMVPNQAPRSKRAREIKQWRS